MRRMFWTLGVLVVLLVVVMQFHQPILDRGPVSSPAGFEAQLHPSSDVHGVLQKS
jgi:hypothetical protein